MIMRRFLYIALILASLGLSGCTREPVPFDGTVGGETWVTIPFVNASFGSVDIATKSDTGIVGESRVKNIFLFIFSTDGTKRLYAHFFDSRNLGTESDIMAGNFDGWWLTNATDRSDKYGAYTIGSPDESKWTHGGMRIKAPAAEGKIYAVVNIDGDMINVSPESLNLIRTESALKALTAHLHQPTIQRNGYFPMTGVKSPVKIVGGKDKVQYYNGSTWTENWYLALERMDAKIQFNIQVDLGSSSFDGVETYRELKHFQPESWQVVNVPKGCTVFADAAATADTDAAEAEGYFDSIAIPTETVEDAETVAPVYGFTFYMMENRESAHKNASVSGANAAEKYHKREIRKKKADGSYLVESGDMWEYAPQWGTYVIIKGTMNMEVEVSSEAKEQTLCADVTYIIHLGDFGSDQDNYDIIRNTYYTYTVHIKGVDAITLEVSSSQFGPSHVLENNSGAMGAVNLAKESAFTFDAHYGQRVFCFDESHIDVNHCFWYVKTPYGLEGIPPRIGGADIPTGYDYKWVHFKVNTVDNSAVADSTRYGKFPYMHNNQPYPGDDSPQLMTVVQFCQYLREQKIAFDNGDENDFRDEYDQEWYDWSFRASDIEHGITGGDLNSRTDLSAAEKEAMAQANAHRRRLYVTVYVDEFYYEADPITPEKHPKDFWKTFCNQPNRMMFLLCDSQFSLDDDSSATGSVITIRQRAIQTPYNLTRSESELSEGWGTEVVDETEGLVWFYSQGEHAYSRGRNYPGFADEIPNYISLPVNSKFNGRYNTVSNWQFLVGGAWMSGKKWSDHLDFEAYNDASYVFLKDDPADDSDATMRWSCLMRNRDNNGNGTIEPEEVRWYMASSEQIIDLYLGGQGLSDEAMTYSQAWANRSGRFPSTDPCFPNVDRWRQHYISSTINRNSTVGKNLPDMIRAEEGPNIGNGYYHMDVYWDNSHKQGRFTTRCVRNLGRDAVELDPSTAASVIADMDQMPTALVEATPSSATVDGNTTYVFDCRNVNEKSLRYYSSFELEPESELGQSARLWKRFETGPYITISDFSGSNKTYDNYKYIYNLLNEGRSICPEGYRIPNLREGAVMMIFAHKNFWNNCANTMTTNWIYCGPKESDGGFGGTGFDYASTGNSTEKTKVTPVIKGKDGRVTLGENGCNTIRCVRDLPD